ncbi:MAG: hypothetical protein IKL49_11810 [Lachnospiraceae bacterium]|nr:hypothetical protein [Lachnospiraceae bacterium]
MVFKQKVLGKDTDFDTIIFSGGKIGYQVKLSLDDLKHHMENGVETHVHAGRQVHGFCIICFLKIAQSIPFLQ